MASLDFEDEDGRRWTAWDTYPSRRELVAETMAGGWVTFRSGEDTRRFAPPPQEWDQWPVHRLRAMLRSAEKRPPAAKWNDTPGES
ncbi:MAG TPA: hypothetical protein VFQ76_11225 [Longimicrobiaceae bacterium]|nr:hypothetical protein [Longimicrobiaceae bacterium]